MNLIIAVLYRCLSSSEKGLNFSSLSRCCLSSDIKLRWSNSFIPNRSSNTRKIPVLSSVILFLKRSSGWLESWEGLLLMTDISTTCAEAIFRVRMASAQAVKTSVANNSPSQDSSHPNDLFQSRYVTTGFEPFPYLVIFFFFSKRNKMGPSKDQYAILSKSRSFWPFSNNSRSFQDFRRLPNILKDQGRFPRRNSKIYGFIFGVIFTWERNIFCSLQIRIFLCNSLELML